MTLQIKLQSDRNNNGYLANHQKIVVQHLKYCSQLNRKPPHPQIYSRCLPKALTASLPVFDGKSEKFEFSEDAFRNNIKMYPT